MPTPGYAAHRRFVVVRYAAWARGWWLIGPLWTDPATGTVTGGQCTWERQSAGTRSAGPGAVWSNGW